MEWSILTVSVHHMPPSVPFANLVSWLSPFSFQIPTMPPKMAGNVKKRDAPLGTPVKGGARKEPSESEWEPEELIEDEEADEVEEVAQEPLQELVKPRQSSLHLEDAFDCTGRPTNLVGPDCPPGMRAVPVPGSKGGLQFLEVTKFILLAREGMDTALKVPKYVCITPMTLKKEDLTPRAKGERRGRCRGRLKPLAQHNEHTKPVPHDVMRERCLDFAVRHACALWGKPITAPVLGILEELYHEQFYLTPLIETRWGKVPDKFKKVIKDRTPYAEDHNHDLKSLEPVITYEIKDFLELIETNAYYIYDRIDGLMAVLRPKPKIGYEKLRGKEIPDRTKPCKLKCTPPGKAFCPSTGFVTVIFIH